MIDIQLLPQKAQNELLDFYQFLLDRYVNGKKKRNSPRKISSKGIDLFFDKYNIDLNNYTFNRDELYER